MILFLYDRLLQDVANLTPQMCSQCAKLVNKPVNIGQSVHLPCLTRLDSQSDQLVQWYFLSSSATGEQHQQLLQDNSMAFIEPSLHQRPKYVFTSDGGLVVLGITAKENGVFECRVNNRPLFKYNIMIDTSKFNVLNIRFGFQFTHSSPFSSESCEISNEKDFVRMYTDWCQEVQKYKVLMQNWQLKQQVSVV